MNKKKVLLKSSYPWMIWFLGAGFFFYKYVLQVSPSVMNEQLMSAFSITGAQLGNLAAFFFYAYLIMQIPVGLLLDKYGVRLVMTVALLVCSLGVFLFSRAQTLGMAEFSRALMGLGAAFAAVSCFKLVAVWFPPKRFALMAGLSMTAAMLGAVFGEAPLSFLVGVFDWRVAMLYVAIPGFVLMFLVWFLIRNKDTSHHDINVAPQISFSQLFNQIKIILKDKQTWLLSLYSGLAFAPISVFGGLWGVSFLKQAHHLSANSAAASLSIIFIGFAIGCPLSGWFSDYIHRRKVIMLWGTIVALVSLLAVLYLPLHSQGLLNVCMLFLGLGASCFFLCFSMIREIHSIIFAATVLGFMNTFDSICEALSEPFIGKLLDLGWSGTLQDGARVFSAHNYFSALAVLPLYFIIALFLLRFIKETYCQQREG